MFAERPGDPVARLLPNNLTVDSMAARQATRNAALTSVLGRMPVGGVRGSEDRQYFMERRGDGVPIILRETQELCGKPPEYRLIDESEVCLIIPAALQEPSPARAVVTVRSAGQPLSGAGTVDPVSEQDVEGATTNEDGEAVVNLHTTHLPMTVFVAAHGYAAHLEREWTPNRGALAVNLEALPEGGAVIFSEATGCLPKTQGETEPNSRHTRSDLPLCL